MPVYRSFLPFWFKVFSLPILLWMVVALTLVRHDDPVALAILRAVFLPYAMLATGCAGLILFVRSLYHAK